MDILTVVCLVIGFQLPEQIVGIYHNEGNIKKADKAILGQFPWMVNLKYGTENCGGSIIDKQWILTAAHCFYEENSNNYKAKTLTIKVGVVNKEDGSEGVTIVYPVKAGNLLHENIFKPVEYVNTDFYNGYDIALIRLDQPLVINKNVQVIQRATADDIEVIKEATAAGWGLMSTSPNTKRGSNDLLYVNGLKIQTRKNCKARFDFWEEQGLPLPATLFCTGCAGKKVLNGDSGGPLFTQRGDHKREGPPSLTAEEIRLIKLDEAYKGEKADRYEAFKGRPKLKRSAIRRESTMVQIGVNAVYWGDSCLFTNVPKFNYWIDTTIRDNTFTVDPQRLEDL